MMFCTTPQQQHFPTTLPGVKMLLVQLLVQRTNDSRNTAGSLGLNWEEHRRKQGNPSLTPNMFQILKLIILLIYIL
jgi:hypothetical protein